MDEDTLPDDGRMAGESLRDLLRAGLELGVPEAKRKVSQLANTLSQAAREVTNEGTLNGVPLREIMDSAKADPNALVQIAKEVWSRGGRKEKERAATAVGAGLGSVIPHRALQLAKELAAMARSGSEADMVGSKAIAPILERSPMLLDRVKQLLSENQKVIRQAAIAGIVYFVGRKRKYLALGLEVIFLVAQENEKEIRAAVRWALKQFTSIDPKATAAALAAWAKQSPTAERAQAAAEYAKRLAGDAKLAVERTLIGAAAKIAGNGNGARTPKRPAAARSAKKKAKR